MLLEIGAGLTLVPAEEARCHQRGCHDFGVAHLATLIFTMSNGFEQIIDDDVDGYNFSNHLLSLQALRYGYWRDFICLAVPRLR